MIKLFLARLLKLPVPRYVEDPATCQQVAEDLVTALTSIEREYGVSLEFHAASAGDLSFRLRATD